MDYSFWDRESKKQILSTNKYFPQFYKLYNQLLIEDELNLDKLYSSTESTVKIHENGTSTLSKGQKRISTKELKNDIRKYLFV